MNEHLLYRSLRRLKNKEVVTASRKIPAEFSAVSFDKALELLVKAHKKESQNIEQEKDEILEQWRSMTMQERKLAQSKRSKNTFLRKKKIVRSLGYFVSYAILRKGQPLIRPT